MRNIKRMLALILLSSVLICFALPSCQSADSSSSDSGSIVVVATNFALYDFARELCGDLCRVEMLLTPGAEAHDFEATLEDIALISRTDVFVYVGGESEEWVDSVLSAAGADANGTSKVRALDVVQTYEEELVEGMEAESETDETEIDEHVWTSIPNAVKIITEIKAAIAALDPSIAAQLDANEDRYIGELQKIDADIRGIVDSAARKTIVVADRFPFRYFAEEYGLDYYAAFAGCSSAVEPSLTTVDFLINKVKSAEIPAVLIIEFSDGKTADAISRETGCEILTLHSAHNVTKADFEAGMTYADIMRANAESLKTALN